MKDLFFLLLVVFSLWTFISAAVMTRKPGSPMPPGVRKNSPAFRNLKPAASFSAGPSKNRSCYTPKCRYKETKINPNGGCPIIRCLSQNRNCPTPKCGDYQRRSYSGKKLNNGCQEITCVNIVAPKRSQRRKGPCPEVASCKTTLPDGHCSVPRNIIVRGRRCPVCPEIVKCSGPSQQVRCPVLRNCPKAKIGQCVIPSKDENGCKKCPTLTFKCNQISQVGTQLG
ncbi:uncharacterized protein LOC132547038 [Ylistrum balloti]|uniref:uncharacterized protein LOC132547038 n=1 Tax=Ylistrum balloti TaxID=509963 RepID=UPI002905BB21|nr:uncharacterized protein LOC132547038 [Ylistrum balloti]